MGPAAPEHATSDDVIAVSGTAWLAVAKASAAGTVVLRKQDLPAYGDAEGKTLILVEDAPLRRTLELFAPEEDVPASGVHPSAVVDPSACVGQDVCMALLFRLGPGHVWPKGSFLNLGHMWVLGQKLVPELVCDATPYWVGIVSLVKTERCTNTRWWGRGLWL